LLLPMGRGDDVCLLNLIFSFWLYIFTKKILLTL
jgi:hypothetical protein